MRQLTQNPHQKSTNSRTPHENNIKKSHKQETNNINKAKKNIKIQEFKR